MVEEGFLEERTLDLHFGRWVGVSLLERKEEQSEQKPRQEITLYVLGAVSHPCGLKGMGRARLGWKKRRVLEVILCPLPNTLPRARPVNPQPCLQCFLHHEQRGWSGEIAEGVTSDVIDRCCYNVKPLQPPPGSPWTL